MEFRDTIFKVIQQAMPVDAHIDIHSSLSSFYVSVAWRLNNDPSRPNKMSRTICIHVSHEAAQDFANVSENQQSQAYARITRFLQAKLASFEPNHDAPRHAPPPAERWDITTDTLFG
jgi:hypothetical protein